MARDPLLPAAELSRIALIRRWITATFAGRALAAGAAIKLIALLLRLVTGTRTVSDVIDTIGDIGLVTGSVVLAWRLFVDAKRRLLWRVRRKLTISYIFIGVVPVLLIVTFFVISGLLLFFNVAAYMLRAQMTSIVDQTQFLAQAAAVDLQRAAGPADAAAILERRRAAASPRYPAVSYALLPAPLTCGVPAATPPLTGIAGPWSHRAAPDAVPAWVPCTGYRGLVAYREPDGRPNLAARAAAGQIAGHPTAMVVVDVPLGAELVRRLRDESGFEIEGVASTDQDIEAMAGKDVRTMAGPVSGGVEPDAGSMRSNLQWVAFVDHPDWDTGNTSTVLVAFRLSMIDLYRRIVGGSTQQIGNFSFEQVLLFSLAVVAGLFLVIQAIAFLMGLSLARSITGAVHELFAGTERVRRGEFSHKIAIRSRDQLGELADSFNSMTGSIEDLLQQKAEKERLEQELRIARSIQMSLLPHTAVTVPGISLTAHCEPAREVGGDYYDFLPLDDQTLGIMVADVSGKGTSAALYMAELKGIVLSLGEQQTSPRTLLIDANRIISRHLDNRSFITAAYTLIDLRTRTLRYARAGHCPMIFMPGPHAAVRTPQILTPDGMVLGLRLDDGQMFTSSLREITLPLAPGDLFVLYTDGITEVMNEAGDCFGDERLAEVIGAHADLPADELRERILRDVGVFGAGAPQQDDMTMVLIRVDEIPAAVTIA